MKKILIILLIVGLVIGVGTGCTWKVDKDDNESSEEQTMENPKMQAVIDEVNETELLVTTIGYSGFDKARVNIEGFELDFTPEVGQTIDLTILPQVGMSYPAFTNPVEIKLVK